MIKMPLADKATVPAEKILVYLLNLQSKDGRGKAIFFRRHGFYEGNWPFLAEQLIELAQREPVFATRINRFGGANHEIRGVIVSPQGRLLEVKSIWFFKVGMLGPRLVTAFKLEDDL